MYAAHLKHGSIVRLAPNEISISGFDGGVKTVYGGGFDKPTWYSAFDNYGYVCIYIPCQSPTSLNTELGYRLCSPLPRVAPTE